MHGWLSVMPCWLISVISGIVKTILNEHLDIIVDPISLLNVYVLPCFKLNYLFGQ